MRVETLEGSRVRAIVEDAIMVRVQDVVPGDILHNSGNESDPIVDRVEHNGAFVRFHYRRNPAPLKVIGGKEVPHIEHTVWMQTEPPFEAHQSGHCFIHDLKRERDLYL